MKTTVKVEGNEEVGGKPMREMEPCEVGVVVGGEDYYKGEYVMRTPDANKVQVIMLTPSVRCGGVWPDVTSDRIKVRPLHKGEKVTITFEGE